MLKNSDKIGKKILIIEDEKPMRKALENKLGNLGFKIGVAPDGEKAMEILDKETFDLVLLDLILPKKDGFAVLAEMKAKKIETPVVVLTVLSQEEDMNRARALGAENYFVKIDTPLKDVIEYIKNLLKI